jgi:Zn-dependent protease
VVRVIGSELTIQLVVLRLFAGLILATVQGAVIAAAAVLLGDKGPRHDGRLTLVPFNHVDLLGLGSIMLSGFGWSKPVAIETAQLRFGRWGLVIAALAGSAMLLAIGYLILLLIIPLLTLLPYTAGLTAVAFVRVTARLCVWMALFTLLPVPPLAGAHLLAAVGIRLPAPAGILFGWGLLLASVFGITRTVLTPVYDVVAPLVLGLELAG